MGSKQQESAEVRWQDRLARFEKSGLSVIEFCRREHVSQANYYRWKNRLRQEGGHAKSVRPARVGSGKNSPPFVPVNITHATWTEVEFPNGVRVRVPVTDAEALRTVLVTGTEMLRGEVR